MTEEIRLTTDQPAEPTKDLHLKKIYMLICIMPNTLFKITYVWLMVYRLYNSVVLDGFRKTRLDKLN